MDREIGNFARCGKHPYQFFTGFCSFCLMERLSTSTNAARTSQGEIVEASVASSPDTKKQPCEVRSRKTLLLLFQLDDNLKSSNPNPNPNPNPNNGASFDCRRDFRVLSCAKDEDARLQSNSDRAAGSNAHADEKTNGLDDRSLNRRGISFWLSSLELKKSLRLGTRDDSKRNGVENNELERNRSSRYFCDRTACHESSKVSCDLPRHSWDGSMVSKAPACFFPCLEERLQRSIPQKPVVENHENADSGRTTNERILTDERALPSNDSSSRRFFNESGVNEPPHQEVAVPGIIRKKPRRWSKVWDRSITSPIRDCGKKGEHVLDRSLSESWKDARKEKRIDINGDGFSYGRANQRVHRRLNSSNGGINNLGPDWRKKWDHEFGRSRSVHYTSPGNLDNGLLRFYLTPLRSRRSTNRGRRKVSRSFAKSLFGLH